MKTSIKHQKAFLAAFAVSASLTAAAKACGLERTVHYRWLKEERYRKEFKRARRYAAQTVEDEAIRRATEGVYEPLVYQGAFTYPQVQVLKLDPEGKPLVDFEGKPTGQKIWINKPGARPIGVYKKSDTLIMFLLKAMKPRRYRETVKTEVTGANGGPIENALTVSFVRAADGRPAE